MSVIFGTTLLAMALTSFAPARMMPACSESRPTMKPLTSCKNSSRHARLVAVHDEPGGLVGAIDVDDAAELRAGRSAGLQRLRWLATTPTGTPPSRP